MAWKVTVTAVPVSMVLVSDSEGSDEPILKKPKKNADPGKEFLSSKKPEKAKELLAESNGHGNGHAQEPEKKKKLGEIKIRQ